MSRKFTMSLTDADKEKIRKLKERFGFTQTSELLRFLMTMQLERLKK